jgi:hypothetical protein
VSPAILAVAAVSDHVAMTRPYSASRIFDTAQIRRLITFASAADVTIQHFHGVL